MGVFEFESELECVETFDILRCAVVGPRGKGTAFILPGFAVNMIGIEPIGAVGVWTDIFVIERVGVVGEGSSFLEGLDTVSGPLLPRTFFGFGFFVESTGVSDDMIRE